VTTVRIKYRQNTAAGAAADNPVLLMGEPGLETDTGRTKLGDGVTAWLGLPYDIDTTTAILVTQKGAASGVATLDADGLIPAAQIGGNVAQASATATITIPPGAWSPATGASVSMVCGGPSDVFMVTAIFDVNVTTAGAANFEGIALVDGNPLGGALAFSQVAYFGLNNIGRATVSVVYVATGLAPGNRGFSLNIVKDVAVGVAQIMKDSTTITVLKVR